jgi:hypothetical protein
LSYLGLFADDTCIYTTESKEDYVLRKLQRGLSATEMLYEHWNVKINEDKTAQAIFFSRRLRPPEAHLALNGWNSPIVSHVKYLVVIFDKVITWRLHTEIIESKAFRTFIRISSIFISGGLSDNIKLILHKALRRSVMTYVCPVWEFAAGTHLLKLQRLQNKVFCIIGNFHRCTPFRDLHTSFNLQYV